MPQQRTSFFSVSAQVWKKPACDLHGRPSDVDHAARVRGLVVADVVGVAVTELTESVATPAVDITVLEQGT